MRPDLVLDATGKQERFKKYLRKKDEERMKADQDQEVEHKAMPPLQPIPGRQTVANITIACINVSYRPHCQLHLHCSP